MISIFEACARRLQYESKRERKEEDREAILTRGRAKKEAKKGDIEAILPLAFWYMAIFSFTKRIPFGKQYD